MTSQYRWVIVAAGGFIGCIAIGSIFALPVFLQPMSQETGWSRTEISAAMTIAFVAMGLASFLWGMAVDRFGPRIVLLCGSTLLGVGLALASRAPTPLAFQLLFGVLVGAAGGAIFPPLMATVTGWFETRRSLAVSLVSAGMGMAPMIVAPIAAQLVIYEDWRSAMLMIAIAVWLLLIPAAFLIRRPPALANRARVPGAAPPMSASQALRSPQFIVLALTYFCCCAAHSGPIFHTVSYAITCGLPVATAVTIYSVEGLAGLAGRVVFGLSGDRFGAKPVLVTGLLIQALAAGAYALAGQLDQFYAVAIVFGMAYAGVMPLYAVIARETFPLQIMGTVIGAASLFSSLGMSLGPLAGGLIFDATASYRWLYLGSLAIGLGAMAIMLTFRPARRPLVLTVPN